MRTHDLAEPDGDALAGALLLHPHPDMGGDRFNNVVSALFGRLPDAGVTAVRFDFTSSDVETAAAEAVEHLDALPDGPRFVVGYSFGGGVAATITDPRVSGWFLVAPALVLVEATIAADARPKMVAAAEHDQFFPPDQLDAATANWHACEHCTVPSADHFFAGRADVVAGLCVDWMSSIR